MSITALLTAPFQPNVFLKVCTVSFVASATGSSPHIQVAPGMLAVAVQPGWVQLRALASALSFSTTLLVMSLKTETLQAASTSPSQLVLTVSFSPPTEATFELPSGAGRPDPARARFSVPCAHHH